MSASDEEFARRLLSVVPDSALTPPQRLNKATVTSTLSSLSRVALHEHEKQRSADATDQVTNDSIGGLYRARTLAQSNPDDTLAASYAGRFLTAEYFTRAFDAIKGHYFERVITAKDPNDRLITDEPIDNLPAYILEPDAYRKTLDCTPDTPTPAERRRLDALDGVSLNLRETDADLEPDSITLLGDTLVFGEQRTSVLTGGSTARKSLFRKVRFLVDELSSNRTAVSIPRAVAAQYDCLDCRDYTLAEFISATGISSIAAYIGILFNSDRETAAWEDDVQRATSRRLLSEFYDDKLSPNPRVTVDEFDSESLTFSAEFDTDTPLDLSFACLYGDVYVNSLYTGRVPPDATGATSDASTVRDNPLRLANLIDNIESDDVWLGFSVALEESKIHACFPELGNNAVALARHIAETPELYRRLHEFEEFFADKRGDTPDEYIQELNRAASTFAEAYRHTYEDSPLLRAIPTSPAAYLKDVALVTLAGHLLEVPVQLQAIAKDAPTSPALADAHQTLSQYVYAAGDGGDTRRDVFRAVRSLSVYDDGVANSTESSSVNWANAPTKTDIGEALGRSAPTTILNRLVDGTDDVPGGVLERVDNSYAVAPEVASYFSLPSNDARDDEFQTTLASY